MEQTSPPAVNEVHLVKRQEARQHGQGAEHCRLPALGCHLHADSNALLQLRLQVPHQATQSTWTTWTLSSLCRHCQQLTNRCCRASTKGSFTRRNCPAVAAMPLLELLLAVSSCPMRSDAADTAAEAELAAATAAAASACISASCRGTAFCWTLMAFSSCTSAAVQANVSVRSCTLTWFSGAQYDSEAWQP